MTNPRSFVEPNFPRDYSNVGLAREMRSAVRQKHDLAATFAIGVNNPMPAVSDIGAVIAP